MPWVDNIEKLIIRFLLVMLLFAVILGTLDLGRHLIEMVMAPPIFLIEPEELFHSFGLFLIVLVGLELIKLVKMHLQHHHVRPEMVVEVAIIALCNKIVTLNIKVLQPEMVLSIAVLLLALAVGYYLIRRGNKENIAAV